MICPKPDYFHRHREQTQCCHSCQPPCVFQFQSLVPGFTRYLNTGFDLDILSSQLEYCKWSVAILAMSSHTSIYLIVAMTFERVYSIIRPHKAASFNTMKRAKITIIFIVLFHIIYGLPHLFVTSTSGRSCVPFLKGMSHLSVRLYYWLDLVSGLGLPFLVLLIMNSIIIHTLRKRSSLSLKMLKNEKPSQGQSPKLKTAEKQIIIMLLFITFSFLILMIPSYFMLFYGSFVEFRKSPKLYAGFYLTSAIGTRSFYTNFGINFYLYVISGQKFRRDLKELIFKMCFCSQKSKSVNTTISSTVDTITENF